MIAVCCLNPAIDKTLTGQSLTPGQVNRMQTQHSFAGGKGINVMKVLRLLGEDVIGLGFLGGFTGDFIEGRVREMGVDMRFIKTKAQTRTTLNVLTVDGFVTEILEPGEAILPAEAERFLIQYEKALHEADLMVLSGSLPAGLPSDLYADLIDRAHRARVPVVLDSSGEALRLGISKGPDLVKPNVRELEMVLGEPLRDEKARVSALRRLLKGGVGAAVLSMGAKGMLGVKAGKESYLKLTVPSVKAVNTVGSGDVAVAVLAAGMAHPTEGWFEESFKRAGAYATAQVTTLENASVPLEKAKEILEQVVVEEKA